jgi:GNAT superfamily N-acetyltransferase
MPVLLEMASALVAEGRFASFGFIEEKVRNLFAALLNGRGAIFLAERDGEIIGAIACGIGEDWFSDLPLTFDYGLLVLPAHRGGFSGAGLIRAYLEWAASLAPVVNINVGITSGINQERTIGLYVAIARRLGINLRVIGAALSNLG